ncbi:sodium:proton antiporter [Caloramator sp. Dgby_cultured_2]|nr:sodium:proton antiporter [Caloramator sp. Dgby_cultured_2]WDU84487.1 sodium:proton antiporter [Caloramator sp. Dgby_cultured_2]
MFTFTELKPESFFVDPVPQALTLTSIVIGACVTAMALSLVIKIKEKYGTLDADKVRRLNG